MREKLIAGIFLFLCFHFHSHAQQLVGSASHHSRSGEMIWSGSVGEAVIHTSGVDGEFLTQGYLQPVSVSKHSPEITEEDILQTTRLEIFPNPFREEIYVESGEATELTLLDPLGRVLLKTEAEAGLRKTIDLREQAAGTYVLVSRSENGGEPRTYMLIKSW